MGLDLTGKTAWVTGAARGIGLACAEECAAHGASVVLSDIDHDIANVEAARIAKTYQVHASAIRCDVTSPAEVETAVKTITNAHSLDITIANAGIVKSGSILDLSVEDFDAVLAVNLRGVFLVGQASAKAMVAASREGSIINMASTNAVVAIPNQLAYTASKGAVVQLTKAMALGLAPHKIRVNGIGPGSVMTDVLKAVATDEVAKRMILSRTPAGRIGDPREIGKVAVFLASDYASYLTGQTIYPDGGRLALNYVVPVPD
ncbi:MAG: SDR family NAD(P)-dependent oxidoreductase [Pseudomonadota bacterium]